MAGSVPGMPDTLPIRGAVGRRHPPVIAETFGSVTGWRATSSVFEFKFTVKPGPTWTVSLRDCGGWLDFNYPRVNAGKSCLTPESFSNKRRHPTAANRLSITARTNLKVLMITEINYWLHQRHLIRGLTIFFILLTPGVPHHEPAASVKHTGLFKR